jgi:nucleoid DNA-binding protein
MNLREWVKATHRAVSEQPAEKRHRDLLIAEVDIILRQGISVLIKSLQTGDDLRLDDLGHLWAEERTSRSIASNFPGRIAAYRLPGRRVVRFRASSRLLALLNPERSDGEPERAFERDLQVGLKPRIRKDQEQERDEVP